MCVLCVHLIVCMCVYYVYIHMLYFLCAIVYLSVRIVCVSVCVHVFRDDYKFSEMIRQKPLIAIWSLNLIGHPYIVLER